MSTIIIANLVIYVLCPLFKSFAFLVSKVPSSYYFTERQALPYTLQMDPIAKFPGNLRPHTYV